MTTTDERVEFVSRSIELDPIFSDEDMALRPERPVQWTLRAGLTDAEIHQGWAHAGWLPLDDDITVFRYSPEIIADRTRGLPLGEPTTSGEDHPPPGTVDAYLRGLKTVWILETSFLDNDLPRDRAITHARRVFHQRMPLTATDFYATLLTHS